MSLGSHTDHNARQWYQSRLQIRFELTNTSEVSHSFQCRPQIIYIYYRPLWSSSFTFLFARYGQHSRSNSWSSHSAIYTCFTHCSQSARSTCSDNDERAHRASQQTPALYSKSIQWQLGNSTFPDFPTLTTHWLQIRMAHGLVKVWGNWKTMKISKLGYGLLMWLYSTFMVSNGMGYG